MSISPKKIKIPIVEANGLIIPEVIKGKLSDNQILNPKDRIFFSFLEDNLEIKCCVGIFWNKKANKYNAELFLKKFKSKGQRLLLTNSEIFLKCSFSGFGIYYCAISNSYLTNFPIHKSFPFKNENLIEATFEIIPFLPFKLEKNQQLIPLLSISHSPIIPSLQHYDTEWPFVSYIRQILTSSDGMIAHPPIDYKHEIYSTNGITVQNGEYDFMINNIFGITRNICNELGAKYQAIYGIPQSVYTDQTEIKLISDTDFLIYALPEGFQSELPTIISDDFADLNPFHLCSLIRKEIDDEYYFLTIYSPSLNKFYTVADCNINSIDSKPRCYADEYIISALYIRLNVLDIFRFYSPSPGFTPRFNLVDVYEVKKVLFLSDFFNENEDNKTEFLPPKKERADDLDNEPGVVIFPYDPNNNMFPSIPLTCTSSKSVLKLPIDPKIKKFQLVWYYYTDPASKSYSYLPVVVDLTNSSCIKIPGKFDLLHVSSNYLTTPYKEEEALPTGPMLLFCFENVKVLKHMRRSSIAFGKLTASGLLSQYTQPPIFNYVDRYQLYGYLENSKKIRGIEKCNCYIRSYIFGKKVLWEKLPEGEKEINTYFSNKFKIFEKHNFVQFFIELQ